jgi:uncharacterized protein YjbJ (UPF0337 family)
MVRANADIQCLELGRRCGVLNLMKSAPFGGMKMVDKDRVKGSVEQVKGKVKEWAGKVTGDAKTEAEGKADQVKGKVQNVVGGLKDTARGK